MKSPLLVLALAAAIGLQAQTIQFEEAETLTTLPGALMGDNELADVDGDGDLDFLICGRDDGWVSAESTKLLINDGTGLFTEDDNAPFPNAQAVAAQFNDIDGDGDQDLLFTGKSGANELAHLYLNDGSGSFALATNTPFPPCSNAKLDFADVDDDGDDDVFICGISGEEPFCKLFLNEGEANFVELQDDVFLPMAPLDVQFADFNADGDLDLIAAGTGSMDESMVVLYLNDGDGGFEIMENDLGQMSTAAFAAGDLDSDGDADILMSGISAELGIVTLLYLNDGSGGFGTSAAGDVFTDVFTGQTLFHDFDGDNDLDILLSGSSDGGQGGEEGIVSNIYENLGDNNYVLADSLTGSYFSNNAVGDITGDGLADLILSGTTVGNPTFKTWVYFNTTELLSTETLEEIDFDVFPNPTNSTIHIALEAGQETAVEIYSVSGQLVFQKRALTGGQLLLQTDLPSGIYTLVVRGVDRIGSRKVVVIH